MARRRTAANSLKMLAFPQLYILFVYSPLLYDFPQSLNLIRAGIPGVVVQNYCFC